jgi:hypothetical protein
MAANDKTHLQMKELITKQFADACENARHRQSISPVTEPSNVPMAGPDTTSSPRLTTARPASRSSFAFGSTVEQVHASGAMAKHVANVALFTSTRGRSSAELLELRHHLLAEESQRVHYTHLRDKAPRIELCQDAVEAKLLS